MWKHIFGYANTRFCLCQDTGAMNRTPTPGGLFATHFVGVCGYFTDCSPRIHGTNMVYWGGMQSQNL